MRQNEFSPDDAKEFLLNWIRRVKDELRNNPEAFPPKEPGLYISGVKVKPGDRIVCDQEGMPHIIRKGCFE
jgi:hypothetical protein